jgi:hypothetical protein
MKITRKELRSIVMTEAGRWMESYSHTGPDPSQAIPTSDFEWDEETGMAAPSRAAAPSGQGDSGPLTTGDLMALMMADKDEGSPYKLSTSRLSMLSKGNLTAEEEEIVSAGSY